MKHLVVAVAALALVAGLAPRARASEATFERTLTVGSHADLTVQTGSGTIRLTRGSGNTIHIFGRVRSSWGANDDRVREIANHPPIEQTGSIVRIGVRHMDLHNISIDYEVEAPADAYLNASTGSGQINDDGVGVNTRLSTGSGSIHATGLQGTTALGTGSGSIYAEQAGQGDVKAETGSGSIELHNVHGGLRAETGSGSIKAEGAPTAAWRLETGSGSVEVWTGNAAFTLDAESGSGGIQVDREIVQEGKTSRHHVQGRVGGGGPTVRVETGSGGIRIH